MVVKSGVTGINDNFGTLTDALLGARDLSGYYLQTPGTGRAGLTVSAVVAAIGAHLKSGAAHGWSLDQWVFAASGS